MFLFWSFLLTVQFLPILLATPANNCQSLIFNISTTASNDRFGNAFESTNTTSILDFLNNLLRTGQNPVTGSFQASGTFQVAAEYCQPVNKPDDDIALQLLVHGSTYDKTVWNGLDSSSIYSWTATATEHGYATLAVDVIGHGLSSKPDPNTLAQLPLEAAVLHQIISKIRSPNSPLQRTYQKIVFVGHSFGSATGAILARFFPDDFDALILTGFSSRIPFPSPLLNLSMKPAAQCFPRFEYLPTGYLTASSRRGRIETFYGGNFDPGFASLDYLKQDLITVGEAASMGSVFQQTIPYPGKVLITTGDHDILFCNAQFGHCSNILQSTKILFPNSTAFSTLVAPDAGHTFMLHRSGPATIAKIHNWLNDQI